MNKTFCKFLCIFLCLVTLLSVAACQTDPANENDDCVDGECDIPDFDDDGNQIYTIVSPVGYHDVPMI